MDGGVHSKASAVKYILGTEDVAIVLGDWLQKVSVWLRSIQHCGLMDNFQWTKTQAEGQSTHFLCKCHVSNHENKTRDRRYKVLQT